MTITEEEIREAPIGMVYACNNDWFCFIKCKQPNIVVAVHVFDTTLEDGERPYLSPHGGYSPRLFDVNFYDERQLQNLAGGFEKFWVKYGVQPIISPIIKRVKTTLKIVMK